MGVSQQLKKLQGLPQIAYLGSLLRLQDRLPKPQMECLTLFRNFISLLWSNSLACMWADILLPVLDIAREQGYVGHRRVIYRVVSLETDCTFQVSGNFSCPDSLQKC